MLFCIRGRVFYGLYEGNTVSTLPHQLLIGDVFRRNAAVVPDRPAASLGDATITHGALDRTGNRVAHALRERGIGHGDRVVSWADTCLEVLPLFVGLAKLGAVFAPINARLGMAEAADVAALARPSLVVADAAHAGEVAALADRAGVPDVGHFGREGGPGHDLDPGRLETDDMDVHEPALREGDPHVLFFTSGSTGRPKGVVLSHRANYLRSNQGVFKDVPEVTVCMFPLFHMAGFTLGLSAWQTRGAVHYVGAPTPDALLGAIERHRANRFYGIPLIWTRLLEHGLEGYDLASLVELDTGTSAVPIELVRRIREAFPSGRIRIFYGSTECGSGTMLPDADVLRKPGSVGPASLGVDLKLTEEGEICVRSAYLMDGYFENPEATAEALRDGWFHTGDLGALDDEGHLSIVGRKKEIIRSGGESVAPTEVEAVLAGAPGVSELAIVGIPDAQWGEVVAAVVVPAPGAEVTLASLQAHCEGKLAGFKKPRRLALVDALPRTAATGQVQRTLLVEGLQTGAIPTSEAGDR
jgi:acyl-CoA synthetase (AMP-forming)/AMP-acid ligase II